MSKQATSVLAAKESLISANSLGGQHPEFSLIQFRETSKKYALCVPVINEGERIIQQIERMKGFANLVDIIIADGGSTDGSLKTEFLSDHSVTCLLTKRGPGKLSAQMRMAMAFCLAQGYEGCIFVDGNGKDDISAIPDFVQKLEEGFDHIQGSRYLPGGEHENTPLLRHIGVTYLHAPLISLSAGFRYTDTTNGFRAYSRELLLHPKVKPLREVFAQYELHYYLAIRSARVGLKVVEIPVTRKYPKGKVPSKINSWRGYFIVLKTLFKAAFHRFNP